MAKILIFEGPEQEGLSLVDSVARSCGPYRLIEHLLSGCQKECDELRKRLDTTEADRTHARKANEELHRRAQRAEADLRDMERSRNTERGMKEDACLELDGHKEVVAQLIKERDAAKREADTAWTSLKMAHHSIAEFAAERNKAQELNKTLADKLVLASEVIAKNAERADRIQPGDFILRGGRWGKAVESGTTKIEWCEMVFTPVAAEEPK